MNEVSCKVFGLLLEPLEQKGVSLTQIVAGTEVAPERLRNKKERIDWPEYVTIMRNVRPHFTDDEYIEMGRAYLASPGLRFAFVVARALFSPLDFFRWFSKPRQGVGNQMFTCIVPKHRELSPTEIELELTLPDGYEVCWDFYLISIGNFQELPRLFGLPPATVALSEIPNGGRFNITIPSTKVPLLPRIWRFLTRPFTARAAARELKDAHETLIERFRELEDARTKLDRQAARLRTAHTVTDLVQRDVDLEKTLETIAKVLVDEAGFSWAEIRLTAEGEIPRTARYGAEEHEPPLHRALEARGGQRVGEVAVAYKRGADVSERDDLLAFITPALAIALQNAIYRSGLERLVDIRTAELREAQDAREKFFGNISHEIRTPLSIILLAAGDIEKRAGQQIDPRARAGLGSIHDSARKLLRLVDELLLLAAGQEGKLQLRTEPTDLAALVAVLISAWTPMAEAAGLELVSTVPGPVVAKVDPVAIERVATNLLSNAVKYTPRGGRIGIELVEEADGIRLSVTDTGAGISEELAGRLFGRFERADGEHRRITGTGIGLSLVKQLVEQHGGSVEALRREGGGSELRVTFPKALVLTDVTTEAPVLRLVGHAAVPAAPSAEPVTLAPAGLAKGTILLAEDDVRLAEMIAELLSDEYVVLVAHDGLSALEVVKRHQPQLLITDVDMPGMDGIQLSKQFREVTNDRLAPILILSAVLDLGTRVAGLDAGAVDYVTKPFDPTELKARVRAQFRMRDLAIRLHRAEQLSTLGVLTSGLAHELRNPANGVVNAIEPLKLLLPPELLGPDQGVGQLLDVMAECAAQISMLSKQLLGFRDRGEILELRPVPVTNLVSRALSLTKTAFDGVEIRVEVAPELVVRCAPPLMLQVLTNLLENAAHAAGKGGWVAVAASAASGRTILEVSDSGPGVPVELRSKVFEPFFTTKPQGVGTGLGLPVSREIMTRHGGTLEIRERGARAVFVVELASHEGRGAAVGVG